MTKLNKTQQYFRCAVCGNLVAAVESSGVPLFCCGQAMQELIPGSVDAAQEKHLPVVTVEGSQVFVQVGSVIHPMSEEHYIGWITLETKFGSQFWPLAPGQEPKAQFALCEGDSVLAAYAYCNLHGLWKTQL